MTEYYTLDNGAQPFIVKINKKEVRIYINNPDYILSESYLVNTYQTEKIWIGKSPLNEMTEFSGGYGDRFDGNSILLKLEDNRYVYIGHKIKEFIHKAPIVEYVSPVGNSLSPYPYAIDKDNNYYLMVDDVIIKNYIPSSKYEENPYNFIYESRISNNMEYF